ncbi:NfeD family protein [Candidatus Babeliales bacterium]|nr:NfeD family protein [Candidatus Babeliales bacterium]
MLHNLLFTLFFIWLFYTFVIKLLGFFLILIFALYIFNVVKRKSSFFQGFWKKHETNVDALIRKKAVVLRRIVGKESGLVKVCGQVWSAETDSYVTLDINEKVIVERVYKEKLMVRKSAY